MRIQDCSLKENFWSISKAVFPNTFTVYFDLFCSSTEAILFQKNLVNLYLMIIRIFRKKTSKIGNLKITKLTVLITPIKQLTFLNISNKFQ